jgi:hypothetical protein
MRPIVLKSALPTVRLIAFALLFAAGPGFAQTARDGAAPPEAASAAAVPGQAGLPGVPVAKPKPLRNPSFYTAEVSVSSQNAAERHGATVRALVQVVVRLTGNPLASGNPVIRRSSAGVDALVTSSEFRQDEQTVGGVPVFRTLLTVTFDPESVDALIAGAGLKFWTAERPKPILWLAIDDGRGARLVTGQQTNVVKPLAMHGLERGMRFLLPAGTAAEKAAVPAILALNAAAMQPLTERYHDDAQLLGKVYRQPPGWAADWLLTQGGVELARWSFADSDPQRVIASGVDEGANAIAKRDSVYLDTGVAGLYAIDVVGVNNQSDYIRLMSYLETMAIVRKVNAVEVGPEQMRLQLDLSIGMHGFRTMLATGGVLRAPSETETVPAAGSGSVPRFILQ